MGQHHGISSEADFKTHQINLFLNLKTAIKYLQFGPDMCNSMLIGNIGKNIRILSQLFRFIHLEYNT